MLFLLIAVNYTCIYVILYRYSFSSQETLRYFIPNEKIFVIYSKGSVLFRPGAKKTRKIRNLQFCSLLGLNVFFNVETLSRKNYQCSQLNTYIIIIFLSEWGCCVNIEIPFRLSPSPTFRALNI